MCEINIKNIDMNKKIKSTFWPRSFFFILVKFAKKYNFSFVEVRDNIRK